jgi:hypothetical protein
LTPSPTIEDESIAMLLLGQPRGTETIELEKEVNPHKPMNEQIKYHYKPTTWIA